MSHVVGDPFPVIQTWPSPSYPIAPTPSPRTMPVNIPFSTFGRTIVVMDSDGNLTIKVDQPEPDMPFPFVAPDGDCG